MLLFAPYWLLDFSLCKFKTKIRSFTSIVSFVAFAGTSITKVICPIALDIGWPGNKVIWAPDGVSTLVMAVTGIWGAGWPLANLRSTWERLKIYLSYWAVYNISFLSNISTVKEQNQEKLFFPWGLWEHTKYW